MMKKLLALLLCLTLLSGVSLAETYRFSLTLDAPEVPADASGLQGLLDGTGFHCVMQEDAMSFDLVIGGESLLDLTFFIEANSMVITSSLMPENVLTVAITEADVDASAALGEVYDLIGRQIDGTLMGWKRGLDVTETRGAFSGDAYNGGVFCTTYSLDDADIATLIRGLMSDNLLYLLEGALGEDTVSQLRAATNEMGQRNAYRYLLRIVEDAQGDFIGGSLTILMGEEQVATLSLGVSESDAKLVMGLGLPVDNYWYDLDAHWTETEDGLTAFGSAHEWLAPGDETYAYVAATRQPETSFYWEGSLTESPLNALLTITDDESTVTLTLQEIAPIISDHAAKTPVDMLDTNDPIYIQAMTEFSTNLSMRLLTIIPMDELLELLTMVP